MATEDFSFPTIHKTSSTRSINLPPLWLPSNHSAPPAVDCNASNSLACVEKFDDDQIVVSSRVFNAQEERMDMLWEDFNEELYPVRSTIPEQFNNFVSGDMLRLGCVGLGAFSLSKSNAATNGNGVTNPSMILIVKVLKRLFFLHNSNHQRNFGRPVKR